mmetsp:Transcript_10282/g.22247  ORF Transcript_10282/g.22247 Transcript_10282/m.22247 type:complete len:206 (+) Transcript_10282:436-1053(+)
MNYLIAVVACAKEAILQEKHFALSLTQLEILQISLALSRNAATPLLFALNHLKQSTNLLFLLETTRTTMTIELSTKPSMMPGGVRQRRGMMRVLCILYLRPVLLSHQHLVQLARLLGVQHRAPHQFPRYLQSQQPARQSHQVSPRPRYQQDLQASRLQWRLQDLLQTHQVSPRPRHQQDLQATLPQFRLQGLLQTHQVDPRQRHH